MNFLRVVFGIAVAGIGFVAALVMLIAFFLMFPPDDSLVERLGSVAILHWSRESFLLGPSMLSGK
jgi:hypothetical protein